MKKIALCFSGGLRTYEIAGPTVHEFVLEPLRKKGYDVDVFLYGLANRDGIEDNTEKFCKMFSPKKFVIKDWSEEAEAECMSNFTEHELATMHQFCPRKDKFVNYFSEMYNLKKVFELMNEYETENNFKYDLVIRSRMDVYYFREFPDDQLELASKGNVLIPSNWDFKDVRNYAIANCGAIGSRDEMCKYAAIYDHLFQTVSESRFFHAEATNGFYLTYVAKVPVVGIPRDKDQWAYEWPPLVEKTTVDRYEYGV